MRGIIDGIILAAVIVGIGWGFLNMAKMERNKAPKVEQMK